MALKTGHAGCVEESCDGTEGSRGSRRINASRAGIILFLLVKRNFREGSWQTMAYLYSAS